MDEVAIERIRTFEEDALRMSPDGFHVANSGGKDSVVIRDLFLRSGCKGTINHNLTTVDPPEVIWFLRKHHPETIISKPEMTMWQLVKKKRMPPRRNARFCCEVLKERGGKGKVVMTGVRWGESVNRSRRQMMEACYRDGSKKYFHPIIDWPTDAVWEYIRERELPYCCLYDVGFKRVGCVLCPMVSNPEMIAAQVERWPRLAKAWEKAVKATWKPSKDKRHKFRTPDEYWHWWLWERRSSGMKDDQPVLFEDDPE
jgi:phosphoadenosine phosphosulfate reductase